MKKGEENMEHYDLVASGGTFDMLHRGHEEFIKYQLKISKKILLGITSDEYIAKNPKQHVVQDFEERKKGVEVFLKSQKSLTRVEIIKIDSADPDEMKQRKVDAIVVTRDTENGAAIINTKREKDGLPPLKVLVYDMVPAYDGEPISSTRVRKNEITPNGMRLINKDWHSKTLLLPKELRATLKKPFGKIIKNNAIDFSSLNESAIVTVGDIATKTLIDHGITPKIAVVDFVVEREKTFTNIRELGYRDDTTTLEVVNKPGTINPDVWKSIEKVLERKETCVIRIHGEEDLLVLPMILLIPHDWTIFYGQPGVGMVQVKVTMKTKEKASEILSLFR
jgi:cytidyltransferase-like protein